jgi:hypothetical protein
MKYFRWSAIFVGVTIIIGIVVFFGKGTDGVRRYLESPQMFGSALAEGAGSMLALGAIAFLVFLGIRWMTKGRSPPR